MGLCAHEACPAGVPAVALGGRDAFCMDTLARDAE